MIEGVIIKKLNKNVDNRGFLAEIYRNDELNYKPAMGYVSVTKPNIIRGPHEHRFQTDCFIFTGPGDFEVHLWDRRKKSITKGKHLKLKAGEKNPVLVLVPPGVVHGYKCVSKIPAYCLNLPNKLYKGKNKIKKIDEIRWENDKNSIYQIK